MVLFTSGSEGRPKGVVLSHRNLLANCAQISARVDFNQLDKVFNALPVFHSFGLTGALLLPMLGGVARLHVPLAAALPDRPGAGLRQQLDDHLRHQQLPQGLRRGWATRTTSARCATPFAGAEAIQDETQQLWFDKFGIRILTGYGATETAPVLSLNTPMHYRWGTVGRLLPGIEHRLEPVAGLERGGRLWVKGPNVMLGYLRYEQPGVLEPPEDGWYDTGDIVDLDAQGFVTILGRAKRFAKIGGEMVSLAAVEDFVHRLSPDAQHAVVALPDPRKGERIVLVTTDQALDRDAPAQGRARRAASTS